MQFERIELISHNSGDSLSTRNQQQPLFANGVLPVCLFREQSQTRVFSPWAKEKSTKKERRQQHQRLSYTQCIIAIQASPRCFGEFFSSISLKAKRLHRVCVYVMCSSHSPAWFPRSSQRQKMMKDFGVPTAREQKI
jgi:hypothetical protein